MSAANMLANYQDWAQQLEKEERQQQRILVNLLVDFWELVKDEQGYVIGRLVGEFKGREPDLNG